MIETENVAKAEEKTEESIEEVVKGEDTESGEVKDLEVEKMADEEAIVLTDPKTKYITIRSLNVQSGAVQTILP